MVFAENVKKFHHLNNWKSNDYFSFI